MRFGILSRLVQTALLTSFVNAQQPTASRRASSLTTASVTAIADVTATTQACASVSSLLSSYASASPSATTRLELPAQLAYDCSRSAPIIKEDALNLVDGLAAYLEWQSTLAYLKNPPTGYLLEGVDLLAGMRKLRSQVSAGAFSNEVDFQTNLTTLIGQAHDGHLLFLGDALNIFVYERAGLGNLVSISEDGLSIPQIYTLNDISSAANGLQTSWTPSAITIIDGQNDPDTMYNALFASLANPNGAFSSSLQAYTGPSTSVVFANGTSKTYRNIAYTRQNFTGISSGTDFYNLCCNATAKLEALEAESSAAATSTATSAAPLATPTPTSKLGYPSPVVVSPDGSVAGYFLNETSFEKTAVLAISQETETDALGAQTALTQFLDACRNSSMEKLVIDIQANPGGDVLLGYDFFKQLFPSLEPYAAGNIRAQLQYDVLGSFFTPIATEALQEQPNNYSYFANHGGYSIVDAKTYSDESGKNFKSWSALYGPRTVHGDNFTNVIRLDVSDVHFDEQATGFGIVVSGYGNRSDLAPQPFKSENMILLTDGQCSSTCTIFGHLMKWQGKVKSIAMGGRPRNGPMQYIGGVKGSQVYNLPSLSGIVGGFYENADDASIKSANTTGLKTLIELGEYVQFRSAYPVGKEASSAVTFNLENNIAEGDASTTPLQFIYEAADCRLWWQAGDLFDITTLWSRVAANAFGLNGTQVFSNCVNGSTDASSSLSGNATLFNNGRITNVTIFENDQLPATSASATGGSTASLSSGGPNTSTTAANGAIQRCLESRAFALVVVILSVAIIQM